jgi:DNA-directed RNA polymerase specialized sigma24 family protein
VALAPHTVEQGPISSEEFEELGAYMEAYLRPRFGLTREEREDVIQEVFVSLAKARSARPGQLPPGTRKTMKYVTKAVHNSAISECRKASRRAELHDPDDGVLCEAIDRVADPVGEVESALDTATVTKLVRDELTEEEQIVVFGRDVLGWHDQDVKRVRRRLRWTPKMWEKRAGSGHRKLAEALERSGNPQWQDGKAHLIAAVLSGNASPQQRKRFDWLVDNLAGFRESVAQYEASYQAVLAAVPADAMARAQGGGGLLERAPGAFDGARESVASFVGRGGNEAAEAGLSQASASGGTRGAGAAGAGVMGSVASALGGKAAVSACLGAAATVCVGTAAVVGPPHLPDLGGEKRPAAESTAQKEMPSNGETGRPSELLPSQVGHGVPEPEPAPSPTPTAPAPPPAPAPAPAPEPVAPAPTAAEQEFNDLAPAPSSVPAPTSGGGGGSLSGGGGGAAEQEFGGP